MNVKSFFKPFVLLLATVSLTLGGCNKGKSSSNTNTNGLSYAMPKPVYYDSENDYIFYTDDYFKHRSTVYDEHLATLSIQMAKYSMNPGNPTSVDDTAWYQNQSNRVHKFYDLIGFTNFDANEDYRARTGFDTIGIAASSKVIKEQDHKFTVIACTVRSGGYFFEWENNVFLGDGSKSDMMHEGWYNAANKVNAFIGDYIKKFEITGWIKVWLAGYSRGGAVTNMAGGFLDNIIDTKGREGVFEGTNLKHDDLFVYTFEAPQGANYNSKTVKTPKDALYNNIFNIINPLDIVPKVAMTDWGFQRFGIDKFVTSEFFEPDNFEINRNTVKKLYALETNKEWKCDNFTSYNLNESKLLSDLIDPIALVKEILDAIDKVEGGELPKFLYQDTKKANYNPNIVSTIILEQAMGTIHDKDSNARRWYHNNLEGALRKMMFKLFMDCGDSGIDLKDKSFAIRLLLQFLVYCVFGDTDMVFDLKEVFGFSENEEESLYAVIEGLFDEYPGELISLGLNTDAFDQNHDTDVSVAHVQAQDSFWIEYYKQQKGGIISKVPLRSNAEFFYIDTIDINEMLVRKDDKSGKKLIDMSGKDDDVSNIDFCEKGFAVGYYHYATYERSKAFLPAYNNYFTHMYSHSLDVWHRVAIYIWHYTSNNSDIAYRKSKKVVDENYNMDADVFEPFIDKTVNPESSLLTDLTNTTWQIETVNGAFGPCNISFESNGKKYDKITFKEEHNPVSAEIYYVIYYGDQSVASKNPGKAIRWVDEKYKKIKITGGSDVKNIDAIHWLYLNAALL